MVQTSTSSAWRLNKIVVFQVLFVVQGSSICAFFTTGSRRCLVSPSKCDPVHMRHTAAGSAPHTSAHGDATSRRPTGSLFCQVVFLGVFLHHAPGVVLGDEGDHGAAHHLQPLPRDAAVVAVVKGGENLLGQRLVEVGAVLAVLVFDGGGMTVGADGETVGAVEAFAPPTVHDAEVQTAVAAGLLAAGAGGFEGTARVVEPNIA
jgi:hypothetical protein